MRLKKPETAVLLLVLLAFSVMAGFFLGRSTVAGPVRVIARSAARAAAEDGTRAAPPSRDRLQGAFPVNINTATAAELQALPGIGEARAEAIVAYRAEHGPFAYVEDLRGVSGIGEGILADIMDYITVGEENDGEDLSG